LKATDNLNIKFKNTFFQKLERAEDLLKLSRHQLKMVVAILTGHAPVRQHLHTMCLFEGILLQILQEGD
jgi:hypothetical protein